MTEMPSSFLKSPSQSPTAGDARSSPAMIFSDQLQTGDDAMEQIGSTILSWFNPINAGFFLVCLGVFIWLAARAGDYGHRK
jgi:hypothetical protein